MVAGIRSGLFAVCMALLVASPVKADNPTFSALLAKAKAQADAGHRWTPPGDNMTETIMQMMDLVPTATPAQLSELAALLESDKAPRSTAAPARALDNSGPTGATSPDQQPPAGAGSLPSPNQAMVDPGSKPSAAPQAPDQAPDADATQRGDHKPSESTAQPTDDPQAGAPRRATADEPQKTPAAPSTTTTASLPSPIAPPPTPGVVLAPPIPPQAALPRPYETPTATPPAKSATIPGPRAALLFTRGQDAEHRGDLSAARRFYLMAAEQGEAPAARNLGRLYDPAYLQRTALGGVDPDPALARQWYERAVQLGDRQAGSLLEAISQR